MTSKWVLLFNEIPFQIGVALGRDFCADEAQTIIAK